MISFLQKAIILTNLLALHFKIKKSKIIKILDLDGLIKKTKNTNYLFNKIYNIFKTKKIETKKYCKK